MFCGLFHGCGHTFSQGAENIAQNSIIAQGDRCAIVATVANALYYRYLCQQGDVFFFGQTATTLFAEDVIAIFGQFGRREPRHILHQADNRHGDFVVFEHLYAFACIGQRHLLRCADHDGTIEAECLHQSQVDVARAGRQVYHKIIQIAPQGIVYQLFERIAGHAAAPHKGSVGIDKKADGKNFDAIFFDRHNPIFAIDVFGYGTRIFYVEHFWNRWPEYIGIEQSDFVAKFGKRYGQIGRHGRFADTAFARRHRNDVFDLRQRFGSDHGLRLPIFDTDVTHDFHFGRHIRQHSLLARLDQRPREGVVCLVEHQRKTHFQPFDAQIVLHHIGRHNVFARAGIAHMCQRIENQFRI